MFIFLISRNLIICFLYKTALSNVLDCLPYLKLLLFLSMWLFVMVRSREKTCLYVCISNAAKP